MGIFSNKGGGGSKGSGGKSGGFKGSGSRNHPVSGTGSSRQRSVRPVHSSGKRSYGHESKRPK